MARRRPPALAFALALTLLGACSGPTASPQPASSSVTEPAPAPSPSPAPTSPESYLPPSAQESLARAVWVHLFDDALKTRAGVRQVVADVAASGATALIAEVVRRQDAYYDSDVLPRTTDPALEPGLDVLATLVAQAHAVGLTVHAWVPLTPTWHAAYADLPAPAGWVTTEHGKDSPQADRWVTRTVDGAWDEHLDPALPQVRDHLAAVVGEIAARYDVDGVHLDYVRYPGQEYGYHPQALERFRAETGASGTPAPDDPTWSRWRRAQVDALVAAAREAVRATGSRAVVSAAVIAWGEGPGAGGFEATRAYTEVFQDWPAWARSGALDAVLPMDYFRESDAKQAGWLRQWLTFEKRLAAESEAPVVPGVAGYLNAPDAALVQVGLAYAAGDGVAMYSYQGSTDDAAHPLWAELARTGWGRE